MNDPNSSPPIDSGQDKQEGSPLSADRRRFAKGVAPVVLGTLVSRPVLAVEYACTLSGQMSGNASAHNLKVQCQTGMSPTAWAGTTAWPGYVEKGALPAQTSSSGAVSPAESSNVTLSGQDEEKKKGRGPKPPAPTPTPVCESPSGSKGTPFNGYGGLAATFYYATSSCAVGTASGSGFAAASMLQVLSTADDSELFRLGRAVVASLLNVLEFPGYPVTQARIVEMFNAVKGGGSYYVAGADVSLTRLGVIQYLERFFA